MSDEFLDVKKSIFIKALNCFDENLVFKVMFKYSQDYDDIYNSVDSKDEREYFDFMQNLYLKVDELMEKENVHISDWELPCKDMPIKESQFIKALSRVDGDLLDKVLDDMDYGIEELYESFYMPKERLYIMLMNEIIEQVENIKKEKEGK